MQRTIYLHGYLNEYSKDPVQVFADSVAEAIHFLTQIFPKGDPLPIRIEDVDSDTALFSKTNPLEEIHIYPEDRGSGGDRPGLGQILIGAALIGVTFLTGGATLFAGTAFAIESSTLMMTGAMMALGGLVQMLTPVPDADSDQQRSQYTQVNNNTAAIGTPVPIIYGTARADGHWISIDVDAVEVAPGQDLDFDGGAYAADHVKYGDNTYFFPIDRESPTISPAVERPVYSSIGAVPTKATGYAS